MALREQDELKKLKLVDLKKMCSDLALPISGSKADLIDRIVCHESEKITLQPDDEAELLDGVLGDEDIDVSTENTSLNVISGDVSGHAIISPAVGCKRPATEENADVEGGESVPAKITAINFSDTVTAFADFMPTIKTTSKLTQEERIALRGQRFGGTAATPSSAPGMPRDGKMLERAKRFGLPVDSTPILPDGDTLKVRADRFGVSAANATEMPMTVEEEEEKKRKRLEKFDEAAKKKAERAARFCIAAEDGTVTEEPATETLEKNGESEKLRQRAKRFGFPVSKPAL